LEPSKRKLWNCIAEAGKDAMKNNFLTLNLVELALIGIASLCGGLAFVSSSTYAGFHGLINSHFPSVSSYLPLFFWVFLFIIGFLFILVGNKGSGGFTWLVVVFSLPTLLSFNSLDLLKIIGSETKLTSTLPFYGSLCLGVMIAICYILLNYMTLMKRSRRSLAKRGANEEDVENINTRTHQWLFYITLATVAAIAIIVLSGNVIEQAILPSFENSGGIVILIGLGCTLILAVYVYWMGSRRTR
jgi:hypothetical protein